MTNRGAETSGRGAADTPRRVPGAARSRPYRRLMPPAGLLAIIALGLVLAYVIPQRLRERGDYAMVRTEDRYSADMRVVRSSARRMERPVERPSHSGEVPLLVTGTARAQVASLGSEHMSRPAGPLDKAATAAQRERIGMHRDQAGLRAERAAAARRRTMVAGAVFVATAIAWVLVATVGLVAIVAALLTAGLVATVGFGARAAAAERRADSSVRALTREVEAAATATQALRTVARARSQGRDIQPSDTATQAIKIVTAEDLAPLAAPAPIPAPEIVPAAPVEIPDVASSPWAPRTMPVPAYALKASVRQQTARPLSEQDFAASQLAAQRAARAEAASERAAAAALQSAGLDSPSEPTTASGALDAILARRRATAS